jgi:hypothetical protein
MFIYVHWVINDEYSVNSDEYSINDFYADVQIQYLSLDFYFF